MTSSIIVIAPHPDDETLGCGGTVLRHIQNGDQVHWIIITHMNAEGGFKPEPIASRESEIKRVKEAYGFTSVYNLKFPAARLETIPLGQIVQALGETFKILKPEVLYIPHAGDPHSDHRIVHQAAVACTKWFRYPSLKRALSYETLSETDLSLDLANPFQPNVFVDIDSFLEKKIEIMKIYASEIGVFPFPRSEHALRSLASVRGSASGFMAAEAFVLLKERF